MQASAPLLNLRHFVQSIESNVLSTDATSKETRQMREKVI